MLKMSVQARGNKVDLFCMTTSEAVVLRAKPIVFEIGKRTTDPELAMLTLPAKEARALGHQLLRATGSEDE